MADIFLSYTEKDRDTVRAIAEALQSWGWSVWWDRRIPAGSTWRELLEREMQAMRCMVVVWSSHSIASDWVCEEAAEGRLLGRLIPVAIEAVRPPAGFREIQAADLVGWDGTTTALGMQRLIEDIERRIGRPGDDATTSAPTDVAQESPATTTEAPAAAPPPIPPPAWSRRSALLGAAALAIGAAAIAVGAMRPRPARHDDGASPANGTAAGGAADRPTPVANVFGGPDDTSSVPAVSDAPAASHAASDARIFRTESATAPATATAKTAAAPPTRRTRTRCGDLQLKAATGEPLSSADRSAIERECTK